MEFKTFYNDDLKEWRGHTAPLLYHPNVSIGQVILNALEKQPNHVIQVNDNNGIEMTTDQLKIRTIRTALHLSKFNLTNDDCIGIVAKNNHHTAPVVIAALLIGVPINPLDPSFDSGDIEHIYNLTKPKVIFCDYDVYAHVKRATDKIGLNPTFITFDERIDGTQFVEDYFAPIDGDDEFISKQIENGEKSIALIICSSGTTGLSKAISLSHAQVTHQFTTLWKQTDKDVYLYFSSLYWITGLISLLNGSITCCKRIITTERFTPELFMKIVQKYRVTQTIGPPAFLGLTLQHPKVSEYDLSSLGYYFCGGSVVPKEYVVQSQRILKNCKVQSSYGLSELGGIATINSSSDPESVGYIAPNIKMRIIDDVGNYLGVNMDGEIILKTVYFFLGYKGDLELSKAATNTDGWIYSGDIGRFDQHGRLYVLDRKKDILKYRNFAISPSEIEAYLLKCPFVKNISVVGIPDLLSGDLPAAVLVKTLDCVENDNEIKEIVYNLVKDNLADHKLLRGGVYIVEQLPFSPNGKILKRKVRELAVNLYNQANNV